MFLVRRENWWGLRVFSPDPPKNNFPKMEIKWETTILDKFVLTLPCLFWFLLLFFFVYFYFVPMLFSVSFFSSLLFPFFFPFFQYMFWVYLFIFFLSFYFSSFVCLFVFSLTFLYFKKEKEEEEEELPSIQDFLIIK